MTLAQATPPSRMGELAVDVIKIDKSFIDKILVDDSHRQIIDELIAMCHKLDLPVVAEAWRQKDNVNTCGTLAVTSCRVICSANLCLRI